MGQNSPAAGLPAADWLIHRGGKPRRNAKSLRGPLGDGIGAPGLAQLGQQDPSGFKSGAGIANLGGDWGGAHRPSSRCLPEIGIRLAESKKQQRDAVMVQAARQISSLFISGTAGHNRGPGYEPTEF